MKNMVMWETQCHKPSLSHHHFDGCVKKTVPSHGSCSWQPGFRTDPYGPYMPQGLRKNRGHVHAQARNRKRKVDIIHDVFSRLYCISMYTCVSIYLSVYLTIYLSIDVPFYPSIHLSIYLSIYLARPSKYLKWGSMPIMLGHSQIILATWKL